MAATERNHGGSSLDCPDGGAAVAASFTGHPDILQSLKLEAHQAHLVTKLLKHTGQGKVGTVDLDVIGVMAAPPWGVACCRLQVPPRQQVPLLCSTVR